MLATRLKLVAGILWSMVTLSKYEVAESCPSRRWASIELLWDSCKGYRWTPFHRRTRIRDRELRGLFGSDCPPPNLVALHDGGACASGGHDIPVLLIPGATRDANYFLDPCEDGRPGLPQYLKARGRHVFALSFAHSQDDNFQQAAQIGNAIARIRDLTGAPKVDLIAHSKGGIAARIYTGALREDWMQPFGCDVRRLLLIGVPNAGVDYFFRYPQINRALLEGDEDDPYLNWPASWIRLKKEEGWVDVERLSYGSEYWPGQRQLLARWSHVFGLPKNAPDWESTYFGGQGSISESLGIDHYIEQGGCLIDRLRIDPVHASVEVYLLAGDSPTMPRFINDTSGPSDGIIYVESALEVPFGTRVGERQVLPLHHKELVCAPAALSWVQRSLA